MSTNLDNCMNQYQNQRYECLTITLYANILWKDRNVLCLLYGHSLVDEKIDSLLKFYHKGELNQESGGLEIILTILKDLIQLPELPRVIDLGLLKDSITSSGVIAKEALISKLWYIQLNCNNNPKQIVLYGFGRIGRLLARELCTDPALRVHMELKAVVTRDPVHIDFLKKRASLIQKDSIHGLYRARVEIDAPSNSLIINGQQIRFIQAEDPAAINYHDYGINDAILIDNTGKHRDFKGLSKHLTLPAISNVIVTAPGKDIPNIVFGINHEIIHNNNVNIYSMASCTTNAITPLLKLLDTEFGIEKGHLETIHAYTNDQNLVDNMHAKNRRGRAAALNMVITETGAGKAISKILPQLENKLTSNAVRVPIANGSLAILVLDLNKEASINNIHQLLIQAASVPIKHKQIDISFDEDLVSTDIIGRAAAGIVDGCATSISSDGKTLTLYVWYDNEYGYSMQVLSFARWLSVESVAKGSLENYDFNNFEISTMMDIA